MSRSKENISPYRPSKQVSPDRYSNMGLKQLTLVADRLCENTLPKQLNLTKKLQSEKKRVRQLQTLSTTNQQKVKQLQMEVDTVRRSLLLQIEMYKQMLREQDEEKTRHMKSLQSAYNAQIQRLLNEHDQQARMLQTERDELDKRLKQQMQRTNELENKLQGEDEERQKIQQQAENSKQYIKTLQERLVITEQQLRVDSQKSNNEMAFLSKQVELLESNHRRELENIVQNNEKKLQDLKRLHSKQLMKVQQKHKNELVIKRNEIQQITKSVDNEGRRLQDVIALRDRQIASVLIDLRKQRQNIQLLTKQMGELVKHKEMLIMDMHKRDEQKLAIQTSYRQLEFKLRQEQTKHQLVISNIRGEITRENSNLGRQMERLRMDNDRLKKQLSDSESHITKIKNETIQLQCHMQQDTKKIKTLTNQLANENKQLRNEVKTLKDLLLESSVEMQKCKEQFIRLDREKQRLLKLNITNEQQHVGLKVVIAEKDMQQRHDRSQNNYISSRLRN